ncbi:CinA family protein [Alloscardovia theropitheci]|uniref:CinA family protein n=1 Tax=Alloscardovia theropitheci TaxID=2496842 RepID=A0A4R0R151_9BIFI|nr:CinA family protein [Alloscardovia theropitheci]TCD54846.1 CinA family protein [Alloscardovia theropitheci]
MDQFNASDDEQSRSSLLSKQDELSRRLLEVCSTMNRKICCAESLTGGLLADAFVRIPGASATYRGSINTYAVDTKASILGVDSTWLDAHGPVNSYTAEHMATGALELFACDGIALSTTGVAGPGPDGNIPAGTVYIGCAVTRGEVLSRRYLFTGDRELIRYKSVCAAIELALDMCTEN